MVRGAINLIVIIVLLFNYSNKGPNSYNSKPNNSFLVCCLEVVLYVKRRNTIITFVGRRTDDNTYWFGNKIMVSTAEIVGIDALVWKPEVESWTVPIFICSLCQLMSEKIIPI